MTAREKAGALVSSGLADDLADATEQLVDMGEISQDAADRITAASEGAQSYARRAIGY